MADGKFIKMIYNTFDPGYDKAKVKHFPCVLKKKEYVCGGSRKDLVSELNKLGLVIIPVPGDGDCFYHSVDTFLKLIDIDDHNYITLRQKVADELMGGNMDRYIPFIMGFINEYNQSKAEQFLKDNEADIRTPGEWNNYLGELPSQILPTLLGYDFKIYSWGIQTKPLLNNNGKRITNENGVVSIPDYKYLAETQVKLPVGRSKGTVYILNDTGHYELLMPKSLYEMEDVQDKIKAIKFLRNATINSYKPAKPAKSTSRKTVKAKKPNSNKSNNNKSVTNMTKLFNAKMYLTEKPSATTGTRRSTRIAKKAAEVKAAEGKAAAGAGKNNESPKLTIKQQKLYNQLIKNGVNSASARLMATMD
jgi:hypothetical protein